MIKAGGDGNTRREFYMSYMIACLFKDFAAALFNDPTLQEKSLLRQAAVLGALNRHLTPTMTQTLPS